MTVGAREAGRCDEPLAWSIGIGKVSLTEVSALIDVPVKAGTCAVTATARDGSATSDAPGYVAPIAQSPPGSVPPGPRSCA